MLKGNIVSIGVVALFCLISTSAVAMNVQDGSGAPEGTRLLETFADAQESWIQGDLSEARNRFVHIAGFRTKSNLSLPDKQLIHYSLLRLAQLSEETERDEWLREASQVDDGFQLDTQAFPQELLSEYKAQEFIDPNPAPIAAEPNAETRNEPDTNPYWDPQKGQNETQIRKSNKWLWIGAGVLLTGLAYHLYQESERPEQERVQPQHHYGFQ